MSQKNTLFNYFSKSPVAKPLTPSNSVSPKPSPRPTESIKQNGKKEQPNGALDSPKSSKLPG